MLAVQPIHAPRLTVHEFVARWRERRDGERSSAQEHFLDLCRLVGSPWPKEADPSGSHYVFERRVRKLDGTLGFADVWYKDRFAWEYKGRGADLDRAYLQLQYYREDLGNPPLLIVSDTDRILVHTNFDRTEKKVYDLDLESLDRPGKLEQLRWALTDPDRLRPTRSVQQVTEDAAIRFASLSAKLEGRGVAPRRSAHFLVQILFGLFAEDIGLLTDRPLSRLLTYCADYPDEFVEEVSALFTAMQTGGKYHLTRVVRFNGGIFSDVDPVALTPAELRDLVRAADLDWGSIEPAVFGTLFERSLDPAQRRQLGAHYTDRGSIERIVDAVIMVPLRRRWDDVRADADGRRASWLTAKNAGTATRRRQAFEQVLTGFQEELRHVRVLDPACGSGNFLYVALAMIHDLEKAVSKYGAENGISYMLPLVRPTQLVGLEVNPFARELAQVVVWIGHLQWLRANGFPDPPEPVIDSIDSIEIRDALLTDGADGPRRAAPWPPADFIVGNPPFLGGKRLRSELGDAYVDGLFVAYRDTVAREADLCCYFFEQARASIERGATARAGLLATNSIRSGANRRVLERIKASGDIFMAWDDEPWVVDGAAVRVAIVGFDGGAERVRTLDGAQVAVINADLTGSLDITGARRLPENAGVAFMGDTKGGPFDVPDDLARGWIALPRNPNGRPNGDVVRPWVNGLDVTRRNRDRWIVDFGVDTPEREAALYEAPFEYARETVKPAREASRRTREWWLHERPRVDMRRGIESLSRFIVTPTIAKHRLFVWSDGTAVPDHQLIVYAREDDYFFGVLHSRAHEVWSLRTGTSLEDRPRYTPTTCFETFPLPWPPRREPGGEDGRVRTIAKAARELDRLRGNYLNPVDADAATRKARTLTNLYNKRPSWLVNAHAALDRAVWAAYGWDDPDPAETPDEEILARLLTLNTVRAGAGTVSAA